MLGTVVYGGTCKIGILGGIGPEATGLFYNRLIENLQQKGVIESNSDFPQIIVNSIPAPELVFNEISEKEFEPYVTGLKELDNFGIDFAAMVCNTIHLFYERLQKEVRVPIINLRQELRKTLEKNGIKSVLIVGTPNTVRQGLYRFDKIKCFEPNSEEIEILADAIFKFNRGEEKEKQKIRAKKICKKYLALGAETVILGCTEFAVMLGDEDIPAIDTIDVLVEATANRFLALSKKKCQKWLVKCLGK